MKERDKKLLRKTELTLDDQSEQMGQIVSIINEHCSEALRDVFEEAKGGTGSMM